MCTNIHVSNHLLETHMDSLQYPLGSSPIFYYDMWLLRLFLVSCTHGCLPGDRPEAARCFPHFFFSLLFTTFPKPIASLTSFFIWKRTRRDWKIYLSSKCGPPSSSLSVLWCGIFTSLWGSSAHASHRKGRSSHRWISISRTSLSPNSVTSSLKMTFLSNDFLLPTIFPEQVQMI